MRPTPALPLLAAAAGIGTYAGMDAAMKALALGIGAYSALWWRLLVGLALSAALYLPGRRRWPGRAVLGVHAARSVVVAVMALGWFWGITRLPLAEAIALSFIAPLIALALAAVLLGERVTARSIAGSLLGLAGVGAILAERLADGRRPGAAWGAAAVLVSAGFYAVNLVMARHQAQRAEPLEIAFFQNLFVVALLAPGAAWLAGEPPPAASWPLILLSTGLATVSLLLLSWANARAEAQRLVSLEYTAFVWAAIAGRVFFGEAVTAATLAGAALILAGCVVAATRAGSPGLPEAEMTA